VKKSFGYYILKAVTWPMQLFPLEFHYLVSDFLYFWVYYVFQYRKSVVSKNLRNSFPEKSDAERLKIERSFFHSFTDMFIETLYLTHMNVKKHSKRLRFHNSELLDDLYNRGKSIICITGHFGNWEFAKLFTMHIRHKLYFIYKKLNNKAFDQFYKGIRSSCGAYPLEMRQTYRQLVTDSNNNVPYLAFFIGDQRPMPSEANYWMTFLNQDTAVFLGTEKIAVKTNAAVIWGEIRRVKRGYYEFYFDLITENPAESAEFEITQAYMHRLEKAILERPDHWLWSHNRWKHKHEIKK
jgi:Kdo2-lipid IVA lauroyltransferase/acyltransferase